MPFRRSTPTPLQGRFTALSGFFVVAQFLAGNVPKPAGMGALSPLEQQHAHADRLCQMPWDQVGCPGAF